MTAIGPAVSLPEAPPALRLTIDGDALAANWRWLKARGGAADCGAAVKADGYGLGARQAVARLAREGCRDFFVSSWAEAAALGPLPEGCALSVLHGVREADMPAALGRAARPVLNSPEQVARWKAAGGGACDVMVDTGINRLGLRPEDTGCLEGLAIETLMSHLACADEPDHPMNERQLFSFRILRSTIPAKRYSLANSGGICLGPKYAFELTRPGLALYGGIPVPGNSIQEDALRSVITVEAEVLQVRRVEKGDTVGYGATWVAPYPSTIAILNVGYADGLLRPLADGLGVRIGDQRFGVAGRISMDLLALDITNMETVRHIEVGEHGTHSWIRQLAPVMISEGDWLPLTLDLCWLSSISGLSQYELLTGLGRRYQRRWI
ncbi:MAG TPA: alanine racemase [Sphingomonas sp.]|nr:alanine racemase [Sphingomonas sp.]